jgi:hypothetical protein
MNILSLHEKPINERTNAMEKICVEFGYLELEGNEEKSLKFMTKLGELSDLTVEKREKRIKEIIEREKVKIIDDERLKDIVGFDYSLVEELALFEAILGEKPIRTIQFIILLVERGFEPAPVYGSFDMECEGVKPVEIIKLFQDLGYEGEIRTMNEDSSDYKVWKIGHNKIEEVSLKEISIEKLEEAMKELKEKIKKGEKDE